MQNNFHWIESYLKGKMKSGPSASLENLENLHSSKWKSIENSYLANIFSSAKWYFDLEEMEEAIIAIQKYQMQLLATNKQKEVEIKEIKEEISFSSAASITSSTREVDSSNETEKSSLPTNQNNDYLEFEREWGNYLQDLSKCQLCYKNVIKNESRLKRLNLSKLNVLEARKGGNTSISVYFIADYPLNDSNLSFSDPERDYQNSILKGSSRWPINWLGGEKLLLLKRMALAMNLLEEEYEISLTLKCPPSDEMQTELIDKMSSKCLQYLHREICILRPKVIIALGVLPFKRLLNREDRLANVHGQFFNVNFQYRNIHKIFKHTCKVVPIFNLDYILLNPQMKRIVWSDLQLVMKYLGKTSV